MNPEPVWSRFSLDDLRRLLEQVREDDTVRDRLVRHPVLRRFIAPSFEPHHNDGLAKSLRIIGVLTSEERRDPGQIDHVRRDQIARRARVKSLDVFELTHRFGYLAARIWMLMSREFVEEVNPGRGTPSEESRWGRASAAAPLARPRRSPETVDLATLSLDRPMLPVEREALRRHWSRLARSGLIPETDAVLFKLWNRELLLWELTEDE